VHQTWHYSSDQSVDVLKICKLTGYTRHIRWHNRHARHVNRPLDLYLTIGCTMCLVAQQTDHVCTIVEVQNTCFLCGLSGEMFSSTPDRCGVPTPNFQESLSMSVMSDDKFDAHQTSPDRSGALSNILDFSILASNCLASFGWCLGHFYDLDKCIMSLSKHSKSYVLAHLIF
jgi:hypothetical protein